MRVSKTDVIGGLPAEVARELMRKYREHNYGPYQAEKILTENAVATPAAAVLAGLTELGYLKSGQHRGNAGPWWATTVLGNALAMASFSKPITRSTAVRLLEDLLDRARIYNADTGKPLFIRSVTVFGSYLDKSVDRLGDLDVGVTYGNRMDDAATSKYTWDSGRNFSSFIDELGWPVKEMLMILRNKSKSISITLDNLDLLTDRTELVYYIGEDPGAAPVSPEVTVRLWPDNLPDFPWKSQTAATL